MAPEQHHPVSAIITRERPDTPDAISLINELEAHLEAHYPSESRHGLSVEKLLAEDVAFFLLRLETGIHQREAIELYERLGFYRIPPFGPYTDDPLSRCCEKRLP